MDVQTWGGIANFGVVLTSHDGLAWHHSLLLEGWSPQSVVFDNGMFVAVGSDGIAITSTNGYDWTPALLPDETIDFQSVAYADGHFVATSFGNRVLCSTNSVDWTVVPVPTDRWLRHVAAGNGLFVIIAGDQTLTSTNGLEWSIHNIEDSVPQAPRLIQGYTPRRME